MARLSAAKSFKLFLQNNGVKHILSAPYHPSSNGEAERFVRSFKRGMKHNTGRVSKNHTLQEFLLSYRTTPHTLTGKTPSEMVFGRRVRTRMDLVRPNLKEKISRQSRGVLTPKGFDVGDTVLARDYRGRNPSWMQAVITKVLTPVTYEVQVSINDTVVVWKRHVDQIRSLDSRIFEQESHDMMNVSDTFDAADDFVTVVGNPSGVNLEEPDRPGQGRAMAEMPIDEPSRVDVGGRAPGPPYCPEVVQTPVGPRRSQRERNRPKHLDDYECDSR